MQTTKANIQFFPYINLNNNQENDFFSLSANMQAYQLTSIYNTCQNYLTLYHSKQLTLPALQTLLYALNPYPTNHIYYQGWISAFTIPPISATLFHSSFLSFTSSNSILNAIIPS